MQKCLFNSLVGAVSRGSGSLLSEVEVWCEESERKSPDAEGHVETSPGLSATKPEAREGIAGGGLWSLTLGPGWDLLSVSTNWFIFQFLSGLPSPWVRALRGTPAIQRNYFFFADPSFTHWTDLSGGPRLQPLQWEFYISPVTPLPCVTLSPDVNKASRRDVHTWKLRRPWPCPGICCTE